TERAFSGSGLTVSRMRHTLSDKSTRAATVLASWASVDGMIPEAEIIQKFTNKKKREHLGKKTPKEQEVIDIE
ncbi:hypothetical protein K439DRAFT_1325075, partial [Ramaria rubella]